MYKLDPSNYPESSYLSKVIYNPTGAAKTPKWTDKSDEPGKAFEIKTKELLLQELRTRYKVTISGPNTLSALLQSYHLGFQTLKVQQHATQIYSDLRNISSRFEKHFDGIKELRKKLEQAMQATDSFGRDARSIMNTLGNIKDPEQVEIASKNENVEKLNIPTSKQAKN